jgi:hypothetical protein
MANEMHFLYYSSKDYTVVTRSQGCVCKALCDAESATSNLNTVSLVTENFT